MSGYWSDQSGWKIEEGAGQGKMLEQSGLPDDSFLSFVAQSLGVRATRSRRGCRLGSDNFEVGCDRAAWLSGA
jgi:hypothetical protein